LRPRIALRKKLLFAAVTTLLFFVGLELALRVVGVRPILATEDPFVGFESKIPLFVERFQPDGATVMETAENKRSLFNKQTFPKHKPRGTYRIFCLGGSTTYGRPYNDETAFSGWLRAFLPVADTSHPWEVINAGGISYASYRVALLMEELVRYEPDLFIIYSGHNEFLEERTYRDILETPSWVTSVASQLGRTSIYTIFRKVYEAGGEKTVRPQDGRYMLPGEVNAILDNAVGLKEYHRDDTLQQKVIEHYKYNLARLVDFSRSIGAGVVMVTPASNLKDCSPFKSEHKKGLSPDQINRFQILVDRAKHLADSGKLTEELSVLSEAEQIDDRYASLHYRKGCIFYEAGRYEEAKQSLQRARDEDVCPLRALTLMVDIVRQVAVEKNVSLVDFAADMDRRSAHAITDEQCFLDHVHPTIEGNRLLALALVDTLAKMDIVHPVSSWNEAAVQAVVDSVEGRIDDKAHAEALVKLSKVLNWAGKFEEANRLVAKASKTLTDDGEVCFGMGLRADRAGNKQEAEKYYRKAVQIMPYHFDAQYNLALLLEKRGDLAGAAEYYRKALQVKPDFVSAASNLAGVLFRQGKTKEGEAISHETLRLDPDHVQTLYNLSIWLIRQGRVDEAITHLLHVLRVSPDNAESHYNLAICLAQKGKIDEAMLHCQEAIRYKPDFAEAYCNLGALLAQQGRLVEAANYMKESLRLKPGLPGVQEKLEMIEAELQKAKSRSPSSAASN